MSSWKAAEKVPDRRRVDTGPVGRVGNGALPPKVINIEAASLKIDENAGLGGDPYNQTGQHFVAAMKDLPSD